MERATVIISALGALFNRKALLQPYLNWAANKQVERFEDVINIPKDIRNLQNILVLIQGILQEAEETQINNDNIQRWLSDLVDIGYEARDVVDDFITFSKSVNFNTASLSYINPLPYIGKKLEPLEHLNELARNIKSVREKFDEMKKVGETFKTLIPVVVKEGGNKSVPVDRPKTTYYVNNQLSDLFVGREDVKEEIMTKLLDYSDKSVRLISISGMGGVGKTTLVQSIYNDEELNRTKTGRSWYKKWLCIGQKKFSAEEIMVQIIGDHQSCPIQDIQKKLVQNLNDKSSNWRKFLIVLDDVLGKVDIDEFNFLWNPLTHVWKGGVIIITTRKQDVGKDLKILKPMLKDLNRLSDDDCWRIFERYAFDGGKIISRPELEPIGREIVTKLDGLPLAAQVVGSKLLNAPDEIWSDFLKTWELMLRNNDNRIMASLRWSYNLLLPHLKMCFTYFSLFPKDYVFDKKVLVELWMAHDLIQNVNGKRAEDTGADYLGELVNDSLLKCVDGKYVMHDLIHDLALLVSKEEFVTVNGLHSTDQIERFRHVTINHDRNYLNNLSLCKSERLLTLYTVVKGSFEEYTPFSYFKEYTPCSYIDIFQDVFSQLKSIRVLVLDSPKIIDIPDCIGKLGHLRYLDIRGTVVKRLPETLCQLYHLQMLAAPPDVVLPPNIVNMTNLRYVRADLSRCKGVGKLTSLQELPCISVCKDVNIRELGGLRHLRGKLAIKGLENVENLEDARQALMEEKSDLEELKLNFNGNLLGSSYFVLDALKCPPHLTYLKIVGYEETLNLPNWIVRNLASSLRTLKLYQCQKLKSLPPLGEMSSLKHLSLGMLDGIERIGDEFYGKGTKSKVFFPSLEWLGFRNMKKWKEWGAITILDSSASYFPRLTQLIVENCPKLVSVIPSTEVERSPKRSRNTYDQGRHPITSTADVMRSLKYLKIMSCPEITDLTSTIRFHTTIEDLEILECEKLTEIEFGSLQSLGRLTVISCHKLTSISGLVAVKFVLICSCKELKSVRINFQGLDYIEYLGIIKCPSLESISEEERAAASSSSSSSTLSAPSSWSRLRTLSIGHERIYRNNFENSFQKLKSVENLEIYNFDQLQSLTAGDLPHSLQSLIIFKCPQLKSLSGLPDSLKYMEFHHCRQLDSLLNCGIPASLRYLEIHDCPLLYNNKRCRDFGDLWQEIIPRDFQNIRRDFQLAFVEGDNYDTDDEISKCLEFNQSS